MLTKSWDSQKLQFLPYCDGNFSVSYRNLCRCINVYEEPSENVIVAPAKHVIWDTGEDDGHKVVSNRKPRWYLAAYDLGTDVAYSPHSASDGFLRAKIGDIIEPIMERSEFTICSQLRRASQPLKASPRYQAAAMPLWSWAAQLLRRPLS